MICVRESEIWWDKEPRFRIFVGSQARLAQQNLGLGFQIEINESKTPGDEHCLDPPGAELLAWL
jgi:hypothetical protein